MTSVLLPRLVSRDRIIERLSHVLRALPADVGYMVEVREYKAKRSDAQNRYLFGCIYPTILRDGGEAMRGWTAADLHEFFLIDHFGSEVHELFGKKRLKPLRRSSRLSKMEFADYIDHIQRFMAERGVFIPDPDPEWMLKEQAA